jgi:site-specific DNA recombinase
VRQASVAQDLYRRVQLPKSWVKQLTEELEAEIVERQAEASEGRDVLTMRLARLADERQKLLRAFYANAIPLELLKTEQDRISREEHAGRSELDVTEADLEGWQEVISMAIRLAGNCHAAYLKPRSSVRRRFNQAVLEAST